MNFDTNGFDTEEIENIPKRKKSTDVAEKDSANTVTAKKRKSASAVKVAESSHQSNRIHSGNHKKYKAINDPDSVLNIALSYIITFFAIFMIFCTFTESGAIFGRLTRFINFGFFSYVAYALPFVLAFQGITWRNNIRRKSGLRRGISTLFAFVFISSLVYTFEPVFETFKPQHLTDVFAYFFSWSDPVGSIHGGGLFGSALGWVLTAVFGTVGTWLIVILVILLYFVIYFNFNPAAFAKKMGEKTKIKYQQSRGKHEAKLEKRKSEAATVKGERSFIAEAEDGYSLPARSHRKSKRSSEAIDAYEDEDDSPFLISEPEATPVAQAGEDSKAKRSKISDALEYGNDGEIFDADIDDSATNEKAKKKLRSLEGVSSSKISGSGQDRSGFDSYGDDDDTYKKPSFNAIADDEDDDDIPAQSYTDLQSVIKIEKNDGRKSAPKTKTVTLDDDDDEDDTDEIIAVSNKRPVAVAKKVSAPAKPSYKFPPLSLLRDIKMENASAIPLSEDPIALKLHTTLATFNVKTKVTNVARGPRITRYELVPNEGIRIKSIANLVDDISLALATAGIRIEAPIPGKAAVGVEVPNARSQTVGLRALLDNDEFKNAAAKTTICLGADISGEPVYADLAKMPHLLIAGATGMGKSVCINAVITSILYKAHPDDVKLILVDPKKVELSVYSGIPHLLIPVVSDPAQAAGALSWAVSEMESRFDKLEEKGVRNIKGYNNAIKDDPNEKPMSQIVIIIDELADLMMSSPDSVETSICRIAQKARAAGIHLIIGTQRPSVDVITGLIKANIPSRIAFHVSSQIDSRTILDVGGAEKLLNNGDMLFSFAGVMKPKRVQGAFLDDDEVANVTKFLREHSNGAAYDDEIVAEIQRETEKCLQGNKKKSEVSEDGEELDGVLDDPKFQAAVEVAFDSNKISTSLLQRKLKIGFGRASRYIDVMCELGVVSEPDGQKPREVLMTRSEYYERQNRLSE